MKRMLLIVSGGLTLRFAVQAASANCVKVQYELLNGTIKDGGALEITGDGLGGDGKITVKNFKNDHLGIHLNSQASLAILPGGEANPYTQTDASPQTFSGDMAERGARMLKIALNQAAKAGDTVILKVTGGDPSLLSAIRGDDTVSFDSGQVELTLQEGQTEITFALANTQDADSVENYTLSATLQEADADPDADPVTSDYTLTLNGVDETLQAIQTTNTIAGDQQAQLDGQGKERLDSWGNIIPEGAEPDRADTINDTSGNDLINAGGGDDTVFKLRGGDDIINLGGGDDELYTSGDASGRIQANGGDGRDYLGAGSGRDLIEGGAGADGLYGSSENDQIYGDNRIDTATAIAQGATQEGSGQQGEWADAEDGNDQVVTGAGNDLIAGGAGDDLIVSGGGNDWIWGDWNTHIPAGAGTGWRDWSVTENITATADGSKTYQYDVANIYSESNAGSGNDTLYAGAGDDVAMGERGDDTLYLEDGNDKAWGDEGADIILGGAGKAANDFEWREAA